MIIKRGRLLIARKIKDLSRATARAGHAPNTKSHWSTEVFDPTEWWREQVRGDKDSGQL